MGRAKEYMMELEEQAYERHLAKLLGISYDDLIQLEWEIETDESKDGLIYSYRIEFSEDSEQAILSKIERLEDNCRVYLEPWELEAEYDYVNDQFDAITESRINQKTYNKDLDNLKELSQLQRQGDKLKTVLNRQIFINIIGIIETFLSDTFLKLVFAEKHYFQNFVETHPEFKARKFELRDIFKQHKQLENIAKKTILDTIFHNLASVKNMYEDTFKIDFPNIQKMYKYVMIRHDLVHRNGKTKEGVGVTIEDAQIDELIIDAKQFIETMYQKLEIK